MGHPYLRPNVIPELEMVEIPTAAQGYDNIGQPEYDSPARTYSNSSESSGSSDVMSPGTMPDDSSYLQAMQGGKYPQASDPAADLKKRKADTRGIEKKANEKKARKKRGRFELSERIETSITRSWGACLRCHNQRIRCIPNPTNPQDPDMPCQTCLAVDMSTKKAIHQLPCLRYRLQKIVMYRSGGLNITDRFRHTELVDLFDYPDSEVRTLEISQGICKRPVVVKVRRFNASKDDRLARVHKEGSSLKEYGLPPYCLSDIEETAKEFKQYLLDNALDGLQCAVQDSHEFIKATYGMILQHYQSLPDQIAVGKSKKMVANEEKRVLWDAIVFWFALRHMVGSSWVSGGDTRGLWRLLLPYKVLDGKISTPRMIIAQFESIQHERILKYQAPIVLKSLQKLYYTNNLQHWFTIYCITFMLLHYASLASADRKRWAEQRSLKDTRYGPIDSPLTRYIEELQEGTTYLLAHWHYYKHSVDLLKFDWDRRQGDSSMKHLTPEQGEWMKASSEMLRNSSDHLHKIRHDPARWEDEVYFVSKMYEHTWSPDETFSVTKGIKTQGQ